MYLSVHYTDLPMLLTRGFRYGIADTLLWGVDRDMNEWQVILEDGGFALFGQRLPKGNTTSHKRMKMAEFRERFPPR